jgi:predicted DsbA family dithiol-disulfide isomerase
MPELIVAHDVVCPWCWVAIRQAEWMRADFPTITLRWVGYELLPEGLPYIPKPKDPIDEIKPEVPSRFELLLAAERLTLPKRKNRLSNSRLALEGGEFAFEAGKQHEYIVALYHAYWEEDRNISDLAVLKEVAERAGLNSQEFVEALQNRTYRDRIVEFDDPAHAAGIYNVPTWKFTEKWVAEQPYSVLKEMCKRYL